MLLNYEISDTATGELERSGAIGKHAGVGDGVGFYLRERRVLNQSSMRTNFVPVF